MDVWDEAVQFLLIGDRARQLLAVTRSEDQTSLTMPTIKGHSSRRILVVARRESKSVLLAALRGLHLDSLLGDDGTRLDRGMHIRALSDALVCIRSDEQQPGPSPPRRSSNDSDDFFTESTAQDTRRVCPTKGVTRVVGDLLPAR